MLTYGIERLEQTGKTYRINGQVIKARKKTNNKWFETQDSIKYWDDFSKQKIVWGEISDKPKFAIDTTGQFVPEATTFLMVGGHLKYLLCFLNSSVSEYFFAKYGTTTGMGTLRWKKYLIELLPIPKAGLEQEQHVVELLDKLLIANADKKQSLKQEINNVIYNLFDLNFDEIAFIENAIEQGAH